MLGEEWEVVEWEVTEIMLSQWSLKRELPFYF